jgi:hypothetical protein
MRAALIEVKSNDIVHVFDVSRPRRIDLPGVGQVSPAEIGWEGDGYKIVAVEELPPEPEGKRYVGPEETTFDGQKVIVAKDVEDIPRSPEPAPQPEPEPDTRSVEQKLADAAGVTVAELIAWRDDKATVTR